MTDMAAILQAGLVDVGTLYVGFVSGENFTGFNRVADTMGSHSGWEEFEDYSEGARPEWTPGTIVDGNPASVNNPSGVEVTPTVDGEIIGIFLCDDNTLGGTTGQLYGPWFLKEGPQDTVAGTPFRAALKLNLKGN